MLVVAVLAGKFVTGEWAWESVGAGELRRVGRWVGVGRGQGRLFSERGLGEFGGSEVGKPIYLAVSLGCHYHHHHRLGSFVVH